MGHYHTWDEIKLWTGPEWFLPTVPELADLEELFAVREISGVVDYPVHGVDYSIAENIVIPTTTPNPTDHWMLWYSCCQINDAPASHDIPMLFVATTDNIVRRYYLAGEPGSFSLALRGTITLPATYNAILSIASAPDNSDLCFIGASAAAGANIRLLKLDFDALTTTELWSKTEANSSLHDFHVVSSTEFYFLIKNELSTLTNAIYYTTNGTVFVSAGKGYSTGVSLSPITCYALAVSAIGAARRIYVQHNNANFLDSINTPEMLSYSDDLGVTWVDVLNTGINRFVVGNYGYVSLVPDGDGSTNVYFSNANGGGGIQTPYLTGLVVTLNAQFTAILDSAFAEGAFYVSPLKRYLADRNQFWVSSDRGATWVEVANIGVDNNTEMRTHIGYSTLPDHDYLAAVTQASQSLYVMSNYATWEILTIPSFGRAVCWWKGRN